MKRAPAPTLTARARDLQRLAAVGSRRRKAAGVAAVLIEASRSGAGARRLLARHRLPAELKTAVLEVLAELEQPPEGGTDV